MLSSLPVAKDDSTRSAEDGYVESAAAAELNVVMIPVEELKPDPRNPRNNTSAIEMIAASIRDFGFKVPIVVNTEKQIVAGHARYLAARMLRLHEVPCVIADDLTPEQQLGFSIAENRTSDFSFFDLEKLAEITVDLPEQYVAEFDLESLLDEGSEEEPAPILAEERPTKREGSTSRRSRSTST